MNTIAYSTQEIVTVPTITAAAYTSGKQLGGIQTLTSACFDTGRAAQLLQCTLFDVDAQNSTINILVFNQSPTVTSVDTGTYAATAANQKLQLAGQFQIQSTDYVTVGGFGVASVPFQPAFFKSLDVVGNLYVIAVCGGSPTYSTTTSLQFRWLLAKHF